MPYCWENSFRELVSETDPTKFDEKVREVEDTLWNRFQELNSGSETDGHERVAIEDASETITTIRNKHTPPSLP
jgi:hypothetical protein